MTVPYPSPKLQDRMQPTVMRRLLFPIMLLVFAFLASASALLYHTAREQNEIAANTRLHLARTAMATVQNEVSNYTRDYAFWNDTVENLITGYDPEWADDNVGTWAVEELEMDGALVIGASNRILHEAYGEDTPKLNGGFGLPNDLADLVAVAREAIGEPGEGPEGRTSYFRLGNSVYIAAAAAIVWEDERPVPRDGNDPGVLVFYRTVDREMLLDLQERFLLEDMMLTFELPAKDGSFLPLQAANSRALVWLDWSVERAGNEMLRTMILPLVLIALVMMLILAIFVYRAHKTAVMVERYNSWLELQTRELEKARSDAVEANRGKSQFLAMMSHELRTPLNAVIGFSDLIRQNIPGKLTPEKVRGYADDIHSSGRYLLSLINDILDMSKIEAQRYELFEEKAPLAAIIEQSIVLVRGLARDRQITIHNEGTDLWLYLDERAMKQILVNLLSNAVKYSNPGGSVTVKVSGRLGIDASIEITDTGIGMNKEEIEKAFEPFGQTRDAQIRDVEGTGLGLNICKALTELHGGRLAVRSEPGVGTQVIVHLPADRVVPSVGEAGYDKVDDDKTGPKEVEIKESTPQSSEARGAESERVA